MDKGEKALALTVQLIRRQGLDYCPEHLIVFKKEEVCPECKARSEKQKVFAEGIDTLKEKWARVSG